MDRQNSAAAAAAGVTVLLWASAFVGIRAAGEDLSAGPLTLGRLLVGAPRSARSWRCAATRCRRARPCPRLLACGLLWFGAYNVLLNAAEQRIDAGTAAMLVNVGPILLALLAGVLLHEGFPRSLLTGCAIAFAGAVVIGLATSERSADAGWGAALCVAAAAAYAGGVVRAEAAAGAHLARSRSRSSRAWSARSRACRSRRRSCASCGDAAPASVAWTAYLGVFPTAIGFTTWAYALKRTSAGKLGATTYLVPPIAVVLGWAILGETPPALALAGGALCLAGVAVTRGAHRPVLRRLVSPGPA